MTNPYLAGLALVKQHPGTSGQLGLAKCILSLYNDDHAFSIAEVLQSLDHRYTATVLAMVGEYATNGETQELREAGEWVYDHFPRLIQLSDAMQAARSEVRSEWERERRERAAAEYPDD
ncbi:MAG: hypothetical protein ACTHOL_07730 [Luteibacter jiangsuensis]